MRTEDRYLLATDELHFWTGNRLTTHIGEAMRYSNSQTANRERRRVQETFDISLKLVIDHDS